MSLLNIRKLYGVPARRGVRVAWDFAGREGSITGSSGTYIRVLLDGDKRPILLHPTWKVRYLTVEPERAGREDA